MSKIFGSSPWSHVMCVRRLPSTHKHMIIFWSVAHVKYNILSILPFQCIALPVSGFIIECMYRIDHCRTYYVSDIIISNTSVHQHALDLVNSYVKHTITLTVGILLTHI